MFAAGYHNPASRLRNTLIHTKGKGGRNLLLPLETKPQKRYVRVQWKANKQPNAPQNGQTKGSHYVNLTIFIKGLVPS